MSKIVKMVLIGVAFAFVVGCANDKPAVHETVPVKVVTHHKHCKHHHHCGTEKVGAKYDKDVIK